VKKNLAIAILLLSVCAACFGDGYLYLGGAGAAIFDDPVAFAPDFRFSAGLDLYAPLSDVWSTFFSASLFHFFRPVDKQLRYLYSSAWDFSARDGDWFFKAGLSAKGERLYASWYGAPDRFENALRLQLSYDVGETTIFVSPEVSYSGEDLVGDNVLFLGEAGITFPLSERLVVTGKLKGRLTLVPIHDAVTNGGLELSLSHYPDAPFLYTLTLGALLQTSDYTEIVNTVAVKRLDYFQVSLTADATASLSDALLLKILLPLKFSVKDTEAVRGGSFSGEPEWTLALAPEIELTVSLSGNHNVVFAFKAEPFFSNSDYYDEG